MPQIYVSQGKAPSEILTETRYPYSKCILSGENGFKELTFNLSISCIRGVRKSPQRVSTSVKEKAGF